MATYRNLIDINGLKTFLTQLKSKFAMSVNGYTPNSSGAVTLPNMTGATASAAGKAGLVPAPAAGKNNMPLCGDATFKTLPIAGGGTGLTAAPSMLTNLGSTTAASPLQASPRPGITGTLPLAHGGTGATTAAAAIKALIGSTAIGSTTKPIYYDGSKLAPCSDNVGGGVTLKIY